MERDMTRRAVLKAAPALAAIPAVSVASEPEDQTFALIEAHRAAERAHDAAAGKTDSVATGRATTGEDWAAEEAASVASIAAEAALCEYAPPTLAGAKAKAAYITKRYGRGHFANDASFTALVRSIAQMVRA